jgi:hypothetical protein
VDPPNGNRWLSAWKKYEELRQNALTAGERGCPRMEMLFDLIGLALPDTPTMFRLKLAVGGICVLGAGLLFMLTGLGGSLIWGWVSWPPAGSL